MSKELEGGASAPRSPGWVAERGRHDLERRQMECPHEWCLSHQQNGLLVWRFRQGDCPRCLNAWREYWKERAVSAEGMQYGLRKLLTNIRTLISEDTTFPAAVLRVEIDRLLNRPGEHPEDAAERPPSP